jgi:hypothetical protein
MMKYNIKIDPKSAESIGVDPQTLIEDPTFPV